MAVVFVCFIGSQYFSVWGTILLIDLGPSCFNWQRSETSWLCIKDAANTFKTRFIYLSGFFKRLLSCHVFIDYSLKIDILNYLLLNRIIQCWKNERGKQHKICRRAAVWEPLAYSNLFSWYSYRQVRKVKGNRRVLCITESV